MATETAKSESSQNTIKVIKMNGETNDVKVDVGVTKDSDKDGPKLNVVLGTSNTNANEPIKNSEIQKDAMGDKKKESDVSVGNKDKKEKGDQKKDADKESVNKDKKEKGDQKKDADKDDDGTFTLHKEDDDEIKPMTKEETDKIIEKYSKLDPKVLEKYLDYFWSIDDNKNGYIDVHQFAHKLRSTGHYLTDREIARMFADLDTNTDFLISLDEYLEEMAKPKQSALSKEDLKAAFGRFDVNKDGFVCRKDLHQTLEKNGVFMLPNDVNDLMTNDRSGKGAQLDFDDFVHALKSTLKVKVNPSVTKK